MRDVTIKLVRHGQSTSNAAKNEPDSGHTYDYRTDADSKIRLTPKGRVQAFDAGTQLGAAFIENALVYTSPYMRARETRHAVFQGAGFQDPDKVIYEDPRLREVDHGYDGYATQEELLEVHGRFFYRMKGGESAADCYDRISSFLESMGRQIQRKKVNSALIVSHGITIRCFVMRFLHLSVEDFERMRNPQNAQIITIAPVVRIHNPVFRSGVWGVEGIELR